MDVEISQHDFFPENDKKIVWNVGIHGCIVLYPIRVVTIRAITDTYCAMIIN